jgi:RNA polymerase sigma-70 factor (ECF subfamily)
MFAVPFDEIAPIVGRSPMAARQLASRARRRVKGSVPVADAKYSQQRKVVDAFLAAARSGDIDALLGILAPDVVRRADHRVEAPDRLRVLRGARAVAEGALVLSYIPEVRPAMVNGAAGLVGLDHAGRLVSVVGFTTAHGKIVEIDVFLDPARLGRLDVSALD